MNSDDFEKQLQRTPLQPPPAAWRAEILAAAHANIRSTTASIPEAGLLASWRALLARIPLAWGAVAALWLVIIGVNSLMSGPAITVIARSSTPVQHEPMTVWNLQRAEARLLANEQTDPIEFTPRREAPAALPSPRSDRRREDGFGGFECREQSTTVA